MTLKVGFIWRLALAFVLYVLLVGGRWDPAVGTILFSSESEFTRQVGDYSANEERIISLDWVDAPSPDTDNGARLLLRLRTGSKVRAFFASHSLMPLKYLHPISVWLVASPGRAAAQAAVDLRIEPQVQWVEAEGWLHAAVVTPNDNFYQARQENLRSIGLPQAWLYSIGRAYWPIAIVDTGIDLDHPDLAAKIWTNTGEIPANGQDDDRNGYVDDFYGWNFLMDSAEPHDDSSHGSHVAGIAAAHSNNTIGIAGIAWETPLMALKALNASGDGPSSAVAEAILYAADNGAKVINLSLGDDQEYQVITDAVAYAHSKGCLLVAAVGNSASEIEYPAATPGVLAVASVDNTGRPSSFSNRGPQVDLAAPGEEILSANMSNSYSTLSGTSMAAPHVSGTAALVWALQPGWSADQVSQVITETARDIWSPGRDYLTGWGMVDAGDAAWQALDKLYFPLVLNGLLDTDSVRR